MNRVFFSAVLFVASTSMGASAAGVTVDPDAIQLVTPFNVTTSTQVPGKTLKAGSYAIRVVDHLSDRVILQIEDAKGKPQTRFLALENSALRTGDRSTGPLPWAIGSNKTNTLRGFAFPGGAAVEFVYPKADAVEIAKVNTSKVPAIDPASEGRVDAKNLSQEDLQTVTLWTLLATRVGPENASQPAIEAERYKAPAQPAQPGAVQVASSAPAQVPDAGLPTRTANRSPSLRPVRQAPQPQQLAAVKRLGLTALPHTASLEPLFALFGFLALLLGSLLRRARLAHGEV